MVMEAEPIVVSDTTEIYDRAYSNAVSTNLFRGCVDVEWLEISAKHAIASRREERSPASH